MIAPLLLPRYHGRSSSRTGLHPRATAVVRGFDTPVAGMRVQAAGFLCPKGHMTKIALYLTHEAEPRTYEGYWEVITTHPHLLSVRKTSHPWEDHLFPWVRLEELHVYWPNKELTSEGG